MPHAVIKQSSREFTITEVTVGSPEVGISGIAVLAGLPQDADNRTWNVSDLTSPDAIRFNALCRDYYGVAGNFQILGARDYVNAQAAGFVLA